MEESKWIGKVVGMGWRISTIVPVTWHKGTQWYKQAFQDALLTRMLLCKAKERLRRLRAFGLVFAIAEEERRCF